MKRKNGAAPVAAETTPKNTGHAKGCDPVVNLPQSFPLVKYGRSRAEQLRRLHFSHNISGADMVRTVQIIAPKFGKSELSKAENPESYGIEISADALKALWLMHAPEEYARMKKRRDGHKLAHRLSCRVEDTLYDRVADYIQSQGIDVNLFLKSLIIDFFAGGATWRF